MLPCQLLHAAWAGIPPGLVPTRHLPGAEACGAQVGAGHDGEEPARPPARLAGHNCRTYTTPQRGHALTLAGHRGVVTYLRAPDPCCAPDHLSQQPATATARPWWVHKSLQVLQADEGRWVGLRLCGCCPKPTKPREREFERN